ncbi:hypothetical protein AB0D74_37130 [Streptomyces sp. NPDC048278]|uniref:hypothetical protein n=1 Tax=unclassified Streptomyces TaxID=2593676 RepID=UPI00341B3D9A
MNAWLSTRSTWLLVLLLWAITLTGALLGTAFARAFLEHPPLAPFASHLPMVAGGTFFAAVCGAGGLRRRQRLRDQRG